MNSEQELVFYYQLLRQHGLNDSHSGNGSIRLQNGFCITKTGACADTIKTGELVRCTSNNSPTNGASLDALIHQAIYQANNKYEAVLHAHNPYTIAMSLSCSIFQPVDFEGKLYFGDLRIIECDEKNYHDVMPKAISDCLQTQPVAIVKSHGVYAAAENLDLAYKWLCSLEQSAKIKLLSERS